MNTLFSLDDNEPITPYAGTSGWSGSATSRERAQQNDRNGNTYRLEREVLAHVQARGFHGLTIAELRDLYTDDNDPHHGSLSGTLTRLHIDGQILRLTETRHRCKVYVAPQYRSARDIEAPRRNRPRLDACPHCGGDLNIEND